MIHRRHSIAGIVIVLALFAAGVMVASAQTQSFSNIQAITIPSSGSATPYPSTITVAGMSGGVTDVNVTLSNLSHDFTNDIDIMLVGPAGQSVVLMSDAGYGTGSVNITLIFDDDADTPLPGQGVEVDSGILPSGTFQPTDLALGVSGDFFGCATDANLPSAPSGTALSVFNGTNPNGSWSLYVVDDCASDGGSIANGWSLEIVTSGLELSVPDDITVPNEPGQAGAVVTYPAATATDVEDGDNLPAPSCLPASGTFFPLGTTTVECTVTDSDLNEVSDSFTVTVNDTEPPVLTTADITVPATSPAGAIVTYTPTATDNSGQPVTIDCTPVSGTLFAPGTTLVECDLTDNASNSTSDTFAVTVLESSDLLAELRAATIAHVDNPLYERWMTQMLDVSRFALERGRPEIAQLYLRIYDIQLTLGKAIRQISSDDAAELRMLLNQVRDAMS